MRVELARVAVKLHAEHGTRIGVSGMALGVDQDWADAVLAAGMALHAYVPFPQQPDRWSEPAQARWRALLARAADVRYFGDHYDVRLLHERNHGMIRAADVMVAVWRPSKRSGGTWSAVRVIPDAMPVIHLDPDARAVRLTSGARLRDQRAA